MHEARRELNFSIRNAYTAERKAKKVKETVEEVRCGEMPPWYYVLLHPEAKLTDADRIAVEAGAARVLPGAVPAAPHGE